MINAWHLIWIVPLAAALGVVCLAILQVGARYDREYTSPAQTGVEEGRK